MKWGGAQYAGAEHLTGHHPVFHFYDFAFHEQDRPFEPIEPFAIRGRNLKTVFHPLGWQRKIALSKIGEPKVGPSSWRPQRGVIHTKPKCGLSGQ